MTQPFLGAVRPFFYKGSVVETLLYDRLGHGQGDYPVGPRGNRKPFVTEASRI